LLKRFTSSWRRRLRYLGLACCVALVAAGVSVLGIVRLGASGPIAAHADTCKYPDERYDVFMTVRGVYRDHVWYIANRCDDTNNRTTRNYEIGTDVRDRNNLNNYRNVATLDFGVRAWSCGRQAGQRGQRYNNAAYGDIVTPWIYYGPSSNPCGRQADGVFHYQYSDSKYTQIYVNESKVETQSTPQCPGGAYSC
jgi:hypothetical protein